MDSSIDNLASLITTPVINLVIEAIGKTAWSFLLNSTSLVSWSITYATLDFKSKSSDVECSPASCPNEGRVGTALAKRRDADLASVRLVFLIVVRCSDAAMEGTALVRVNKPIDTASRSCLKCIP